jgi:xanthine dehydrogenase accessory factor
VVRGGGDLGTGVAHRLVREGYRVVVLEAEAPTAVRRLVAFGEAVREGAVVVEGVEARRVEPAELERDGPALDGATENAGGAGVPAWVAVLIDPDGRSLPALRPDAVVDARMAKRNLGTSRDDAAVVIGLGPGFTARVDVDVAVETQRGDSLGRLIEDGSASPDTGVPGRVGGVGAPRLLRSPAAGAFDPVAEIGDLVGEGDLVARVAGSPVRARVAGIVRGLAAPGAIVGRGDKVGDVDPRGAEIDPRAISDKARAIGEAVLEALRSRGVLPAGAEGEAY